MAKKRIDVEIGVKNKLASGFKSVKASIRKFSRSVARSMRSVGLSMRRAAVVGVGSFIALIKYGNAFSASMAEVKTMLGDDKSMLPKLTDQVRELSAEFGLAKKTLAEGLYQALSAGVPAENAIDFLRVASKSAVGGVTDVKTSVDGLTSVLNAYGIEASKVSQVSDILFTVVKEGKINFEELSQNIGNIAPFAKVAGVGIEHLSAMIATLVKVDKPERAMTSLRQAMVFAAKEGKPLLQVLNEFEGKSLEDMLAAGVTQKSAAGIAIMSANIGVLRKELQKFENTAGAANAAFEDVQAVRGWQRLFQSILAIVSMLGERVDKALTPSVTKLTTKIKELTDSGVIKQWADDVVNKIKEIVSVAIKFIDVIKQILVFRLEIFWIALSVAIGRAGIQLAVFTTGLYNTAAAAVVAAGGMVKLKAAMLSVKSLGMAAVFTASATAVATLAKSIWDSNKATLALIKSSKQLKEMEQSTKAKYGTRNAETLRRIRRIMQSGTDEEKQIVERLFPQAASAWKKDKKTPTKVTPKPLGLGNGSTQSPITPRVSETTSILSAGDLFTMMQTGTGYKRESELSELQGINKRLDELIAVSGGVE